MDTPPAQNLTPRRRKKWIWALLAGVALLIAILKGIESSPLPTGAYPVLSTADWSGLAGGGYTPHQWLPNGELAYQKKDRNGTMQVWYQPMDAHGPVGAARPGPELPLNRWMDQFYPSPDRQWIAYMRFTPPRSFQTCLVSADGKTTRQGGEYCYGWLSDSRSYLCMANSKKYVTTIHHLDTPHSETIPPDSPGNISVPTTTVPGTPTFVLGSHFYDPAPNAGRPQNCPLMTLRSYATANPTVATQTWQAKVPSGMTFGTAFTSPDGTKLLWDTGKQADSFWHDVMRRLSPRAQQEPSMEMHYFISDLNGDHLRPVLTNALGGSRNYSPLWTPDSKHLSFVYKNQLYLLPVD